MINAEQKAKNIIIEIEHFSLHFLLKTLNTDSSYENLTAEHYREILKAFFQVDDITASDELLSQFIKEYKEDTECYITFELLVLHRKIKELIIQPRHNGYRISGTYSILDPYTMTQIVIERGEIVQQWDNDDSKKVVIPLFLSASDLANNYDKWKTITINELKNVAEVLADIFSDAVSLELNFLEETKQSLWEEKENE